MIRERGGAVKVGRPRNKSTSRPWDRNKERQEWKEAKRKTLNTRRGAKRMGGCIHILGGKRLRSASPEEQ